VTLSLLFREEVMQQELLVVALMEPPVLYSQPELEPLPQRC
jgi:hypothetical protein